MNFPNILTVFRLALAPAFVIFYNLTFNKPVKLACLIIFLLAALTDVVDGFVARKFNLVTKFGKLADPLADKMMQLSALCCLAFSGRIRFWVLFVFAFKEIVMILGGLNLLKTNLVVTSKWCGKVSTIVLFLCVCVTLVLDEKTFPDYFVTAIMTYSILVAVVAFFEYAMIFCKLKQSNKLEQ